MATRTSAIRIAVENMDASIAALRRGGEEGQQALERFGGGAAAANQNINQLDKSVGNFARNARSSIIQQAGYQIGDFAVQVQSGTNVVVAATQQLGQLAGAFGVVGAIAGGVISVVGAGIRYWQQQGEETNKAAEELKNLTESTASYRDMLEALQPLQVAYLENLVQGTTAIEAQAAAIAQAKIAAAGGLPGGTPTVGEVGLGGAQQGEMLGPETAAQRIARLRASYTAEENLRIQFIENRKNEEKGLTDFLINQEMEQTRRRNIKGGGVAGIGGAGDYLGQAASIETFTEAQAKLEQQQAKNAAQAAAAAKAAETLRISNEKLLEQAKLKTQAAQEELDALYMGEDARKRANVERAYELELLAAAQPAQKEYSLALIDEANRHRELALAIIEQSRALEDAQKKIDASPGGVGGHGFYGVDAEEAKRNRDQLTNLNKDAAKEQEDTMTKAWSNIADNVDTITTNMFDDMLTKGKVSFQELGEGVGDMFRTTITGALGDAISQPIRDFAKKVSTGQVSGMMPNWGGAAGSAGAQDYATAVGGGAAGGYVAGSAYAQIAGKQGTYAPVGGAVGGAAGAAIGTAIAPGVGTIIGGALGSMAGSFIGGMFGGEGLGNDQSVQKFGSKVAKAIWSDASFSEENRKITGGIIGQLGQLSEALRATGADINDITIGLQAGAKTGIAVQGKQFGEDADAAAAYAIRVLLRNTTGLSGSQQTALGTTKGRNPQEVMQDLAFAKEFDRITFAGTAAEAAMRDLTEQFDATGRRARALGLDEGALAMARERAMAQLTTAVMRQQRDLGAQFQMAIASTDLDRSLIAINQNAAQMRDTFTDAGYSVENLAQLEAARVANETQARQQAAAQAQAEDEARKQQAEAAAAQRRAEAEQRRQQAIQEAEARKQAVRQARSLLAQYSQTIGTNDLANTIIGINEQFAAMADTMRDAGYAAAGFRNLELARQRAVNEAREQDRRQQRDLGAEYLNAISTSELENTLRGIDLQFAHLTETLKDAGYRGQTLANVEAARVRAQTEAIKAAQRQMQDMQKDMESRILGIGSFYDQLIQPLEAVNQNSMLNPQGQIGAARTAFQRDLAGAGAQDPEAIRRLAGSAGALQGLVQQNYGTAGIGGQYLREVQGGISGTIAGLQQERAAALADLPQIVQKTTVDIIRENRADIDRVVEQLEMLRRDLRSRGIAA